MKMTYNKPVVEIKKYSAQCDVMCLSYPDTAVDIGKRTNSVSDDLFAE